MARGCCSLFSVSLLYMAMQLVVSLGFIYLCPATVLAHWVYLVCAGLVLAVAYVLTPNPFLQMRGLIENHGRPMIFKVLASLQWQASLARALP